MNEHAVHMALRGQAIAALPAARQWENSELTPASGVEYVTESFEPSGGVLRGARSGGLLVEEGLYIITWYGLANRGTQALATSLRALLDCFPAGSKIAASDGSTVYVKGNPIPWRSTITNPPDYPGRAVSVVRVPFWLSTVNPT